MFGFLALRRGTAYACIGDAELVSLKSVSDMASRLKRRSSLGQGPGGVSNTSGILDISNGPSQEDGAIETANEEEERRARRGLLQKRQSFGHGHGEQAHHHFGDAGVVGITSSELAEHYSNCMKLAAENKINVKNAFQLKLIDYMTEMLKKKKSDMDNFQAASCALDASTKIYAFRVDSVHNETLKLASGVGSSMTGGNNNANGSDERQDVGDEGDGDELGRRKKKQQRKKASMVEKNLKNINCTQFDLEFDVDPLFKKVSAQFDTGGGGGQFLANLRINDDSGELLLDSNAEISIADNQGK